MVYFPETPVPSGWPGERTWGRAFATPPGVNPNTVHATHERGDGWRMFVAVLPLLLVVGGIAVLVVLAMAGVSFGASGGCGGG